MASAHALYARWIAELWNGRLVSCTGNDIRLAAEYWTGTSAG
ncbi:MULTISPECIES: hypothetical protein [unclassified Mycobacterium]|nr:MULTISPECIES: hypothetical protein [unclassified Mycobacterium]